MATLIMVIYDGLANAVFESQVLVPLMRKAQGYQRTLLVSFERQPPCQQLLEGLKSKVPSIEFIIIKKLPYFGRISLWWTIWRLSRVNLGTDSLDMIARGPLAGYIALYLRKVALVGSLTIQARGLLAAEYDYAVQTRSLLATLIKWARIRQLAFIERRVHTTLSQDVTIEAVSPALKEYLQDRYLCQSGRITIAQHDDSEPLAPTIKNRWRAQLREQLDITRAARVYCYSGSYKPWQCATQTVAFFKHVHELESSSVLLILTPDTQAFQQELTSMPASAYRLLSVPSHDVLYYLSVADYGIVLREHHQLNWISRPTKYLEYRAAGLNIIHNDTVAYIIDDLRQAAATDVLWAQPEKQTPDHLHQ